MVSLFMNEKVKYLCSCDCQKPITRIYFCRYCSKLRCGECALHEVDSNYCPNCLEYMPSPEARLKKNKCANCMECPCCFHTLSIKATSIQVPSETEPNKMTAKKVHYLFCGFCRWTSRDAGLEDQVVAAGGWNEPKNPNENELNVLLEYNRSQAQKEKMDKERKKLSQKIGLYHLSDKFSFPNLMSKKFQNLPSFEKEDKNKPIEGNTASIATLDVEEFDEQLILESLNLTQVTSLDQRLRMPEVQAGFTNALSPKKKHLLIKRSLRCKTCQHNLSKPEYNPASIKFKLYMAALYNIPEIRLKHIPAFQINSETKCEFTLANPTTHVVHIKLEPYNDHPLATAQLKVPLFELVLPARDDTAEYDDFLVNQNFNDEDPTLITFRKCNKLGFIASITPKQPKGEITVVLKMNHDLVNMTVQAQQNEEQTILLDQVLILTLGKL